MMSLRALTLMSRRSISPGVTFLRTISTETNNSHYAHAFGPEDTLLGGDRRPDTIPTQTMNSSSMSSTQKMANQHHRNEAKEAKNDKSKKR